MEQFHYTYQDHSIALEQYVYHIGSYHYNWHRELELLLVLSGQIEVCVDGTPHILEPDDLILINSQKGHATLARDRRSIAMVLHIAPDFFRGYYSDFESLHFVCCCDERTRSNHPFVLLRACLAEMMLGQGKGTAEGTLQFQSAFFSLVHTIVLHFPPERLGSSAAMLLRSNQDTVDKIVRYIDQNYTQRITLNDLARVSQYNRNYISQFFKAYLGVNFHDYLTRIRLREATLELGRTRKSVSEIALAQGFPDLKSFNSAFRASFGKTPTQYRQQLSEDITQNDLSFKKDFLPWADEEIHQTLIRYVLERGPAGVQADGRKAQMAQSMQIASELLLRLKDMSGSLEQTMEGLERILWRLSDN